LEDFSYKHTSILHTGRENEAALMRIKGALSAPKLKAFYGDETEEREGQAEAEAEHHDAGGDEAKARGSRKIGKTFCVESY
jgi:hypothetical protein